MMDKKILTLPRIIASFLILITLFSFSFGQQMRWYKHYYLGLQAMKSGNYKVAAKHFHSCLRVRSADKKKIRAYGTIFIEYYPHRELGICLYYLGQPELARKQLRISLQQAPSKRAREYLQKIESGDVIKRGAVPQQEQTGGFTQNEQKPPATPQASQQSSNTSPSLGEIGERMSIAVLPFSSQGIGGELNGVDLLDKLITGFVNSKRFKVIERAQLEKILNEQKLGLSGIVDPSTAAEIGKGIGVDAVVLGSVTRAGNSLSIDARLIDTESAAIISAQDAYSSRISLYQISEMVNELAQKFSKDLPIVKGLVINIKGQKLTLDFGANKGVKKGMKCIVYREGDPIIHPVTGKVIGRMINQICVARITEVMPGFSVAEIEKQLSGVPQKLDKVITK